MSGQFLSLVMFSVAMTFSPGPNNVLLASSGVQVGLRRSVPLGFGIVAGMTLLLAISALGLGALVHAEPSIRIAMKAVGSVYLVWLSLKIARAGALDLETSEQLSRRGFMAGFVNTLLNPKGWTMALSAAAGYTALASSASGLALTLALVFAATFVPNWFLWCGGGQAVSRALRTERDWRIANVALGVLVMVSIVPMWLE
jgi:threonine/homoserine/homoserine lactone efflux protein